MKFPKAKTLRSPTYLKYLRGLPCDWCQRRAPSEAAHQGGGRGTATKAPDDQAIPLCTRCHRLSGSSFTPNNVRMFAERFWAGAPWWDPASNPLTFAAFREWAGMRAMAHRNNYRALR